MQVILQGSLRHFPAAELLRFLGAGGHAGTLDLQLSEGERARLFFDRGSLIWAEARDLADVVANGASGSFTLLDDVVLPDSATPHAMDIEALIAEAVKRRSFPDDAIFRVDADKAQVTMSGEEFRIVLRIGTQKTFGELVKEAGASAGAEGLATQLRSMIERGLITYSMPEPAAPKPITERVPAMPAPAPAIEQTTIVPKRRLATLTRDNGEVCMLIDDVYTIGRDAATNTIPITDSSISTHHARITRSDDGFVLEDVGSRNGTFVNGEKITAPQALADNDVIRVGRVVLIFNLAREVKATSTTQRKLT